MWISQLFRPLVELFKKSGYIELTFTISTSHFKDSQSLQDSIVEEFKLVSCLAVVMQ